MIHCACPKVALHDRPPFSDRPSLTGHCGHGWTCSLPRPVAIDTGQPQDGTVKKGLHRPRLSAITSNLTAAGSHRDCRAVLIQIVVLYSPQNYIRVLKEQPWPATPSLRHSVCGPVRRSMHLGATTDEPRNQQPLDILLTFDKARISMRIGSGPIYSCSRPIRNSMLGFPALTTPCGASMPVRFQLSKVSVWCCRLRAILIRRT